MQEGTQNNLPRRSRSYEIAKVKDLKVLLPDCRTKIRNTADMPIRVPKIYPSEALSTNLSA